VLLEMVRWCSRFVFLFGIGQTFCNAKAAATGKKNKVEYFQNCAARGVCDTTMETRGDAIPETPAGTPKGHMKPLGHPDFLDSWAGAVDVFTEPPSPETFWKKYHQTRRPFIVKGGALGSSAMNWTDQYIMDNFGDEVTKVEWRNEDRLTDYCGQKVRGNYIHCPKDIIPYVESRTSIRNFINQSRANPAWKKYIISQMPDGMGKEWNVPAFFNCGKRIKGDVKKGKPWMTQMYENNFWYLRTPPGKIGTSVIHYDMNHQIMCMFSGKKEWLFWDMQTESSKIPMWNRNYQKNGKSQGSDDSPIDGERVDLLRWPEFAKAKWSNTTIEKGDCLFTPANLLHYVRSWSDVKEDGGRNFALMTMYHDDEVYDPTQCIDPPAYVQMNEYDTSWGEFPGSLEVPRCMNHIKMGYPNYKKEFLLKLSQKEVDKAGFANYFKNKGQSEDSKQKYPKKLIDAAWDKFSKEGNVGNWAERIFNSTAVLQLAKDMACAQEGHNKPERKLKAGESWDSRSEYSLAGGDNVKLGQTEETHAEL